MAVGAAAPAGAQSLYQTDLRIASLELVATGQGLMAKATVVAGAPGEARGVQLEFLLPVGVGLLETATGCAAGPSAPGVSSLRARVVCQLGTLVEGGHREVYVKTTAPPAGVAQTFAAFARSDTPDTKPANNYAERTLPR
jgi:hypothetical protein